MTGSTQSSKLHTGARFSQSLLRQDGVVESSLKELPRELARLNREYIQAINTRSLIPADRIAEWRGRPVSLFLRHDMVKVFCIACGDQFAMADYVALESVEFCVNQVGLQQTLENRGPLPNRRTIHAYLTGRLLWATDHGRQPDTSLWQGVVFNPLRMQTFCVKETSTPVWRSEWALMTPGKTKVWCSQTAASGQSPVEVGGVV
jgi:hypothetical protein